MASVFPQRFGVARDEMLYSPWGGLFPHPELGQVGANPRPRLSKEERAQQFADFTQKCATCAHTTSRAYARQHNGKCKKCVESEASPDAGE